MDNFPCMEVMAAKYLRKEFPELKAIAMDSISYDSAITGGDEGFPCHHASCWKQIVNRKNEHCFFLKM